MTFNFRAILWVLVEHEVQFAVVGGMAGVRQGAPIHTQDLDIVYSLEPPNPERLLNAVQQLDASFFGDPRRLPPGLAHTESQGHRLLTTVHGRVDCFGSIEASTKFEDIAGDLDLMELDGVSVCVSSLARLIKHGTSDHSGLEPRTATGFSLRDLRAPADTPGALPYRLYKWA